MSYFFIYYRFYPPPMPLEQAASRGSGRDYGPVSTLRFHVPEDWEPLDGFITFMHRTLLLHESESIDKFSIIFYYQEKFASHVDAWIRFATRKRVRALHLDFTDMCAYTPGYDVPYAMPRYFFNIDTFTELELNFCSFQMYGSQVSWKSLKKLSLKQIELSDDMTDVILAGCPLLEDMVLVQCFSLTFLRILSGKLKSLTLDDMQNEIKIYAPHLLSLTLSGYIDAVEHHVVDLSSLEYVKIDFVLMFADVWDIYKDQNIFKKLTSIIGKFCHVKALTVCNWCVQVLAACEINSLQIPILKCKSLTLEISFHKLELIGIARLLQNSPDLENLMIKTSNSYGFCCKSGLRIKYPVDEQSFWDSQTDAFSSSLHRLRTVRLYSCMSWGVKVSLGRLKKKIAKELRFLKFLLTNFAAMERVDFQIKKDQNSRSTKLGEIINNVSQTILSFPKASSHVEVIFW